VIQELLERILYESAAVDESIDEGESRNLRVGCGSDMVFEDVEGFRRPRVKWWLKRLWRCRERNALQTQESPSCDCSASGSIYYRQNASAEIAS
jgi:hypothetical protein